MQQIAYINRFNSSTSLNTVVEDTASDGDVFPNSARIFLALDMASDEQLRKITDNGRSSILALKVFFL